MSDTTASPDPAGPADPLAPADPLVLPSRRRVLAVAVLGGLGLYAATRWAPLTFLALPAVAWLVTRPLGTPWLYRASLACGLCLFVPGLWWIHLSDPAAAWPGALLLATYCALYLPLSVWGARTLHHRWGLPAWLALPVAWTAGEFVRLEFLDGFGWLLVAHNFHGWIWLIQVADLGGAYAVSFVVVLVATAFASASDGDLTDAAVFRRSCRTVGVAMAVLAATIVYGQVRLAQADFGEGPRVILVQTDAPQAMRNVGDGAMLEHALDVTYGPAFRLPGDLFVWPETAYPSNASWGPFRIGAVAEGLDDLGIDRVRIARRAALMDRPPEPDAEFGAVVRELIARNDRDIRDGLIARGIGKPILIGAVRHVFAPPAAGYYNSALLYVPGHTGPVGWYDKVHLVPFGEYVPLERWFPWLMALTPFHPGPDFGLDAGTSLRGIHWANPDGPDLHLGCLVCFEDTVPAIARGIVANEDADGTPIDVLLAIGNDGWFAHDGWFPGNVEKWYHQASAVFRCVELRIPMGRVTNTGVTSMIDGNGRVAELLTVDGKANGVAGAINPVVPTDPRGSLYLLVGEWLGSLCTAVTVAGLAAAPLLRSTSRTRKRP